MKKYTIILLTLVISSSLLGCNKQSSSTDPHESASPVHTQSQSQSQSQVDTTPATSETTQSNPVVAKQGDTATAEQIEDAVTIARQYKQTEYDVEDYRQIDLNDQRVAGELGLPRVFQQQYDRLKPYATEKFLHKQLANRWLILPQRLAVQSEANVSGVDVNFTPDPVFKVNGILEIAYDMNINVGEKEKIRSTGVLQLQQNDGQWKVINDAYDRYQLANLINRVNSKPVS